MLNREELEERIKNSLLVSNYIDLNTQLTPNGFDLTVSSISRFDSAGALDFSNKERVTPEGKALKPKKKKKTDSYGWWHLKKGAYRVITNEIVKLPKDLIAIAFSRSSLLRMGALTQTGVWDAGFEGKSEFILFVENPFGISIKQNARVIQLVFSRINETVHGYKGIYQNKI